MTYEGQIMSVLETFLGVKRKSDWQEHWEAVKHLPEDLQERDRRYGRVFKVFDEEGVFVIRIDLPSKAPNHPWIYQYSLPKTLTPYKVTAQVQKENLEIFAEMPDGPLKKLCGLINSFPDRFHVCLPLPFVCMQEIDIVFQEPYVVDVCLRKP